MTGDPRPTRRGVLAAVGATALSGCSVPWNGAGDGETAVELDGAAVAEVASGEVPAVADPLPVSVADSSADDSRERAESLLGTVPLPLEADEMPNEAMREELTDRVERARDLLREAAAAPGPRPRLERLASARGAARTVAAAWAFANDEADREAVEEAARDVREDATAFREEWEYVGVDPVRALVVSDVVEEWAGMARRSVEGAERRERPVTNAVTVGERAGDVEYGRATLANARHVGERYRESLSEPRSMRSTFADARESLSATIESRMADLPGAEAGRSELVDADVEETVAGQALLDLHRGLPHDGATASDDRLPEAVLDQVDALDRVVAFERLRDRVADGERFTVESADDVAALRSAAVDAIERARSESADERLAQGLLWGAVEHLSYIDRQLARYDDTVEADHLTYDLAAYVVIEATAAATPTACDEALAALGVE